jgi:glycosyltransferase involved in cell wall biosynthesis
MKILVFNWQDIKNPQAGGAEVHFHEIFSRIVKLGHEVTLFCSSFDGALAEETINGIKIIREGGRYLFNFHVPIRYWKQFHHENFDIVIDDTNKIPFFTPLYIREPLYFIIHHLFDKSIFREASLPIALYVYLMEKLGLAVARKRRIPALVVSPSTRDEILRKGYNPEDIEFAYNCVNHDLYHPGGIQRSSTPLIGYFGRLKKYKSTDHLLKAFVNVKEKIPNLKLIVIGEGDYRNDLVTLAQNLGIANDVSFTGFVDENEKVKLLQQVWFTVSTSSKEGWGLTVIESNACGTTVMGSNVPGLRDAIKDGETGLLYEYGNINELAEKIIMLVNDSTLRERLGHTALAFAQTFDWNSVAKHVVEVLENRIKNKG